MSVSLQSVTSDLSIGTDGPFNNELMSRLDPNDVDTLDRLLESLESQATVMAKRERCAPMELPSGRVF
ncbi:hypothetical protein [Variovorax sp. YR216]|uniref:hypothetical protein n=1 Tax=Variovorax sp. YR216 TaxID=1882828 RepID=UPI00115FA80D|nr:hypothetical protein [Variovorax sp. YR216]